jgi:hypothetical protein
METAAIHPAAGCRTGERVNGMAVRSSDNSCNPIDSIQKSTVLEQA